jgi:drug/metabolite transporter (DMT)-like permease
MQQKTLGILAVSIAAFMWAIEGVVLKLAYQSASFIQTLTIRTVLITLIGLGYALLIRKKPIISRQSIPFAVVISFVGTLIADVFYYYALQTVPVLNAVVIAHIQPVFIIIWVYFIFKDDKLTFYDYIAMIAMLIAAFLVATRTIDNMRSLQFGTLGDLFVLGATVAWALTTVMQRKYLRQYDAGTATFYRFGIAGIALVLYAAFTSQLGITNIYQILVGLIVGIGAVFYFVGLRRLKAAQVGTVELASPFFAAFFAFVILGEGVTWLQGFSMLLLIFGFYFLAKKEV